MPATIFSHQALVLPLKLRWPQHFSGLALCIGSMVPDLVFIGQMTDDSVFSHTLSAQLWFTTPVTMLLVWFVSGLLVPVLLPYLRDHAWIRLHDLAAMEPPRSARRWAVVAWSAAVGGMSHVLIDAITHGNQSGWLVPHLPFLRLKVPQLGGSVPLYDALQVWFTILFAVASAIMWRAIAHRRLLWRWSRRDEVSLPAKPRSAGWRLVWVVGAAAAQGAAVGFVVHRHDGNRLLAVGTAFGAIDFACGALFLAALIIRLRDGWRDRTGVSAPGAILPAGE
jgi:hypothetical protein